MQYRGRYFEKLSCKNEPKSVDLAKRLKHFQWVFHNGLESSDVVSSLGTVHGSVVESTGNINHVIKHKSVRAGFVWHRLLFDSTDGQDGGLRRVQDGGEQGDGVVHSQVRDGDGSSLELFWRKLVFLGSLSEILHLLGDGLQTLGVSILHNWGDQTSRSSNGNRNVNVRKLSDNSLVLKIVCVDLWHSLAGLGNGFDKQIVHRQSVSVVGIAVQRSSELEQLRHRDARRHNVVRRGLLGLCESFRNDLSHGGQWDVSFSTSLATILPLGPVPLTSLREIPFSKAMFLANGEAKILPDGAEDVDFGFEASLDDSLEDSFGASLVSFGASSSLAAGAGEELSPASAAVKFSKAATSPDSSTYTATGLPTGMSWVPSGTRILAKNPSSWNSKSIEALSVSTSAIASPGDNASPTFLCHLTKLPWVMVGDKAGIPITVCSGNLEE
ncbi:hypothetical protein OGAPHI_000851 [Ogataea philodendri]|uniref:Uncharacterized protein n=1 Tax=Ogataea philodendri TaxID=1378263 RepID=A0A9P8PGI3_9ASCO|nr:uncharacterized protein OGAPHI_000851 [Ogataea philodendri]KAH3671140.1 hypothetical protein OGAPHI_000851 [Ogataea philodendri]